MVAEEDALVPSIGVDGDCGPITINAIYKFQKHIVRLRIPDSRIDPSGKTEEILVEFLSKKQLKKAIDKIKQTFYSTLSKLGIKIPDGPKTNRVIHYRENARREVSQYSEKIVRLAMAYSGVKKLDFSSTRREINDQVRVMYNNCNQSKYRAAKSVARLVQLRGWGYRPPGWAVEQVYYDNRSKPKSETKALMKQKVIELLAKGQYVSKHCADLGTYKGYNVIDIPYSGVPIGQRAAMQAVLINFALVVKKGRKSKKGLASPANKNSLNSQKYIKKLIVEDACWHIEILQDGKPLPK